MISNVYIGDITMKIEIFGADWCTFCRHAVTLCESKAISYDYINIDEEANLKLLEERLGSKVKSVPQIFLNGELVPGGYTELSKELNKN